LAIGADAFVSKGNPPEDLLATLRAVCDVRHCSRG
jgi:DNA-binding NarL/FixJ family response regulator